MIPRKIHYCWFGRGQKPELAERCIQSWHEFCSDYEFCEWNEENFDIESAPLYVRQAYAAKKWAFVTDYVRLYVLYHYGGIYMDTDVEVLKPLDPFLSYEAISGFESNETVPTGLMGCRKGQHLFREFLNEYDEAVFLKENGEYDLTTNVVRITNACKKHGLVLNNTKQTIEGFTLFPSEFFCPKDYRTGDLHMTEHTYAIHYFAGSWIPEEQRKAFITLQKYERFFGEKDGELIYQAVKALKEEGLASLIGRIKRHYEKQNSRKQENK